MQMFGSNKKQQIKSFITNKDGKRCLRLLFGACVLCWLTLSVAAQEVNDHIFPANNKAKPFIDFDSKGFLIKGKRIFLVSAGMEYARVPHELWHDRLLRLKRDGFNCVEIYTFWNFHEPQEGKFSFSGDADLNLFLQEVNKLGMYCIARVGPYYCAEWDDGGYPLWLHFKPDVKVREPNEAFQKYVDRFWDHLLPVVFANQINRGGCVILVQLENEHNKGWGTDMPDDYFKHLQQKALSLGLDVPYFFSGLHHGSDPAGDSPSLDDANRPNPWFSTEFWSVWYSKYGSGIEDAKTYERRTWKIIAHGGNGYNYYMAHGGTNFGYTNNNEDAASYDYGAAVGQAGDLRPIYYSFKKMALFARSFQNILENSADASLVYKNFLQDTGVRVTARSSSSGTIVFLDNPSSSSKTIVLNNDKSLPSSQITLLPQEIFPLVHNYALNSAVNIKWATARILGIVNQGTTTSLVVFGEPGSEANIIFSVNDMAGATSGAKNKTFKLVFADVPTQYSFVNQKRKIQVIAVSTRMADNTWFVDDKKETYIVCGPSYIGDISGSNKLHTVTIEEPWQNKNDLPVYVFTGDSMRQVKRKFSESTPDEKKLALATWKRADASAFAATDYNDNNWQKSDAPQPMGADGDLTADAWYRTAVTIDTAGLYTLQLQGADRVTAFVDGQIAGEGDIRSEELTFNFTEGKHTLAFFTAHDGRDKLYGYLGNITAMDRKGLFGDPVLKKGGRSIQILTDWRFVKSASKDDVAKPIPSLREGKPYAIGQDAFAKQEGFGWFQTTLPKPPAGAKTIELTFKSTDENATVFLNDKKIMHHEGWNHPFTVTINEADTVTSPLTLSVFIENYSGEGGIDGQVKANYISVSTPIRNWRMLGGTGDLPTSGDWKNTDSVQQKGRPAFYQNHFTVPANKNINRSVWRINTAGLGHGSVWVNGHNLGRYPEKEFAIGMYIPGCWLTAGDNTLLIYEEDGKNPHAVSVEAEAAAGSNTGQISF